MLPDPRITRELIPQEEDEDITSRWHSQAEIQALYPQDPISVDRLDEWLDHQVEISSLAMAMRRKDDSISLMNEDGIKAHVSDLSVQFDTEFLGEALLERAQQSKVAMAAGATAVDDKGCELFEQVAERIVEAEAALHAVSVGDTGGVNADVLSKVWRIPVEKAERTLQVTTQLNRQDANSSLSRNFGTNDRMLRYRRIKSHFFTDTFFATGKAKSTRGNTCMQLFVSDKGFIAVYPMREVKDYIHALRLFAKEVGAPDVLVADPRPTQKKKEVKDFCNKIGTKLHLLEAETQWANRAELYVGLLKEGTRKDMRAMHSPLVLWDYCVERRALILNATAKNLYQLQGSNAHTVTFGEEMDISNICQFGWYEWVYYREVSAKYPYQQECLGRCLGPARNEGNEMAQWVLKYNGKIVPRRSVRRLTPGEMALSNETEVRKRLQFDANIQTKLGDGYSLPPKNSSDTRHFFSDDCYEPYEDDEEDHRLIPEADVIDATGKPILQQSLTDTLINAEVLLPQGEAKSLAKVVRRAVDEKGRVIGTHNDDPILNTLVYECEFPDGTTKEYAANVIAQNILYESDADGYLSSTVKSIIDHKRSGDAVAKSDKYITIRSGQKRCRQTTVGWKFLIEWRDGSRQWTDLKDLKESNPVEVAEYVVAHKLDDEAAFEWWVPFTLRKRDMVVSAVNSRCRRKSHKYGIEIPTSIDDAKRIDGENKNTFWTDALRKEMGNVGIAFEIQPQGARPPPGWTRASGHIIWDVKMDFTRKARWVKDGHRTPDATTSSYAGVVSRESIRIALTYAALHRIDVKAADIRNAYLQAPSSEKHYIICGPEFGIENQGRVALIRRALYGGKVAGRDFWHHLRSCMQHLGFQSSRADPDVWFRESKRKHSQEPYYEYVLLYTDDVLAISDRAEDLLRKEIGLHFVLKEESIGSPSQYLGGKLRKVTLTNGIEAWAFGSTQYVQAAVQNVEEYLHRKGEKLPAKAPTPLSHGYRPEIDVSPELGTDDAAYFQSLIGVLRWIVELGRVDIAVEVSMMSSHLALPREGHLEQVLHIFAYLKRHHNAEMVFDPSGCDLDRNLFPKRDWSYSAYGCEEPEEETPPDMPKPIGREFTMRVYVDSDHAGDQITRRSRTGFVVFLNSSPIFWMSKKQGSCETSTYGSELVAMKQATEYVKGLRYKLRMMGIPVSDPAYIFGDNQSVLHNTGLPQSTLKKKSNAIAFHFIREGVARDEWRTAYVITHDNVADLLTKPLPSGEKRWKFVSMLLYHLAPASKR